ncbi:MAG: hypothetical protein ACE5DZ_02525 [Mariprofundus sp.]
MYLWIRIWIAKSGCAKIKQIIRKYEKKQAYFSNRSDSSFMQASLHYLGRNIEAAGNHIDRAQGSGTSTGNLKSLIDRERRGYSC